MTSYDVIIRPVISEQSTDNLQDKKYTFEVAKNATKPQIAAAVEEIFKVKVEKVSTMVVKGKPKRMRYQSVGYTSDWKKAIVKLTADSKTIEFFDGMM